MRSRSFSNGGLPNEIDPRHGEAIGRISIDGRVFVVTLASKLPRRQQCDAPHRFKIENFDLAAIESDPRGRHLDADDIANRLTGRELEIAVLVAQGHATKNIAYRLQISEWTVATYMKRIFAKLDVSSRAAMVYRCASLINRAAEAPLAKHFV